MTDAISRPITKRDLDRIERMEAQIADLMRILGVSERKEQKPASAAQVKRKPEDGPQWLIELEALADRLADGLDPQPSPSLRLIQGGGERPLESRPRLPETRAELASYCAWLEAVIEGGDDAS